MSIKKGIKDLYKGVKTVVKDTGIDTAVKKGAKTVNKVGGRTIDNFLKVQDNLASLLGSPIFIIGGIVLVVVVLAILRK